MTEDDDNPTPVGIVRHGRGDITELGRRIGKAYAEEKAADQRKGPAPAEDPNPVDKLACILRVRATPKGNAYTLEAMGTQPYGIEGLRVTRSSRKGVEWAYKWAYAQELMNPKRRIYMGKDAPKKARERAKRAELVIVPELT